MEVRVGWSFLDACSQHGFELTSGSLHRAGAVSKPQGPNTQIPKYIPKIIVTTPSVEAIYVLWLGTVDRQGQGVQDLPQKLDSSWTEQCYKFGGQGSDDGTGAARSAGLASKYAARVALHFVVT